MTLEDGLEKLGLNRKEALIYLSALKLGLAKASEIAKKASVGREAAYYLLKLLQERGFVSEIIKSWVKYYSAVQPRTILDYIEEDKRKKAEAIQEILPELESLQKIALTKPKIEVYEGVDGFKTIVSKLVEKENKQICAYVPEKILHFLPAFHLQFRRRRKERNVRMKMITEKNQFMRKIKENDKEEFRETRFNNAIMKSSN